MHVVIFLDYEDSNFIKQGFYNTGFIVHVCFIILQKKETILCHLKGPGSLDILGRPAKIWNQTRILETVKT